MISSPLKSKIKWTFLIIVSWLIIFIFSAFYQYIPTTWWFDVRSVQVFDTKQGEIPIMKVERYINRPFFGVYNAEVEKLNPFGRFAVVPGCVGSQGNNYDPENDLPDPLDLHWWIFPASNCVLLPGIYRVDTHWTIHVNKSLTREVRVISNNFEITLK